MLSLQAYCKVCYLKNHGPGGKNKYGDKTHVDIDESNPEACIRCKGKVCSTIQAQ